MIKSIPAEMAVHKLEDLQKIKLNGQSSIKPPQAGKFIVDWTYRFNLERLEIDPETQTIALADDTPVEQVEALEYALAEPQREAEKQAAWQEIQTLGQELVGVDIRQLNYNHIEAILAILLWERKALNNDDLTIRPLEDWVERRV